MLAKELAQNGIDVTVYDSKRSVAEGSAKASGILSRKGLESIGVDFRPSVVNTLDGAVMYARNVSMRVKAKSLMAYVVDRGKYAELCAKEAREAGARIVLGRRFDREGIVGLRDESKVIVGADGAVSNVASAFGFPKIDEFVLTYKAEYRGARIPDSHMVGLFFSGDIAKRFFGWSVPYSDDVIEVGVGTSTKGNRNSMQAFRNLLKHWAIAEQLDGARNIAGNASIIPLSMRKKTVKGNVLLVGDAAGQVKATTGGGIVFGSACAKVAAKMISDSVERRLALSRYERAWRKRYGTDLYMHRFVHAAYSGLDARGLDRLFRLSRLFGAERFLSEYGDMDRPSLVLKRFFLRGLFGRSYD
ncbi:MAG: NAD(P)/FAD-dependent oxidoreductase [Candidatus Micrarchaeota archaeon]|nr:NAD(P)/FAD-dependent oxidoreductase [Candidatus Micrarchaeota archaeon]